MSNPRFFLKWEPYHMGLSIQLGLFNPDGSFDVAQPVEFKHYKKEETTGGEAMLNLSQMGKEMGEAALQSLMDELWREGFRTMDIGTAGHLSATQSHLADMRAIVANELGVDLK